MEGKLSAASTTLSTEDCRGAIRMAAQFFPIDNQYLTSIYDREVLSYPFLIQHFLMKDITCRVVERILDRRLKSDQEELKSLKEESDGQKSKGKDFIDSEIECTEDMIDQYDFDIERQKKVLYSWQKGNFSQYAEEIKARVFKYKKGAIFQEEVEKELARYIISLSDKNVQGIFKRFEDILPISREAKVGYTDYNTRDLSREHSMPFKILSSMSMIIFVPLSFSYYTFALAITHIYNTYANSQCSGPIREKVQGIAAELDTNHKNYFKKNTEESPSNKLKKQEVQEIANNNPKL
ncbi:hypothetical protein [Candidatus Mesenet endosymbiont of Phosphuga atrata]|uniref:hypothetical protein n=1 Tax=Candidatus Mesenet endosymbiont of Phosphuga atrata TaxID=3066221 RepID=UPI0030D48D6A